MDTTPILASELQAALGECQQEYESKGIEVQDMLDSLQDMAQEPDPDYEEINLVYGQYLTAMQEYLMAALNSYYEAKVLSRTHHTDRGWPAKD